MKVFIRSGLDYDHAAGAVREGMDQFPLDYSGKTVLVKPNLLGPYPPERAATTHPAVVSAVLEYVRSKNPRRVFVGDSPGMSGYGETRKVADVTGIAAVAGQDFVLFSKEVKRARVQSRFFSELSFPRLLDEVDLIINVPKFKTHALTYVTGAIKNMFGIVVGADKARVHSRCRTPVEFAEAIVDIYSAAVPALNVMDAVTGMEGNGPNFGPVIRPGSILVSDNALAMDTVMAGAMGFKPSRLPILRIAGERGRLLRSNKGLGGDGRIETVGDELKIRKFKKPVTYYILNNPVLQFGLAAAKFLFKSAASNHLSLDRARCVRCGTCAKQCPVEAISMGPYPSIDNGKCISCYCCYELCEYHAWKLPGK